MSNPYIDLLTDGVTALREDVEAERIPRLAGVQLGLLANAAMAIAFELRTSSLTTYLRINPAARVEGLEATIRERLGLPEEQL